MIKDFKLKLEVSLEKDNTEWLYEHLENKDGARSKTLSIALECCKRRNNKEEWFKLYVKSKKEFDLEYITEGLIAARK